MNDKQDVPDTLDLDKIREGLLTEVGAWDGVDSRAAQGIVDQDVMPVVQGLVEALEQVSSAAKRLAQAHHDLINDISVPVSAENLAAESEMTQALVRLEFRKPVDWSYISRFSATPSEIHSLLASGLAEDVHLAYQRSIGKAVAAEAAEEIRSDRYDVHTADDAAARIDPVMGGAPYPKRLVTPEA